MTSPKPTATVALKHLALSIQTGPFGSQLHAEDYYAGGRPVVNPAHLKDGRIEPDSDVAVDEETFARLAQHELKAGDVVIGRRGELGRCGVVEADQEGWLCGTGSIRLRPNTSKLDPRWLRWLLSWSGTRDWLSLASVGTTMENLGAEIVGGMPLPVVNISPQRAIADFLDRETARLDALVAAKQRVLGLLAEKRRALITNAVTRGRNDRTAPVIRLKFVLDCIDTGFTPQSHNVAAQQGQCGVLKSGCVNGGIFNSAENKLLADEVEPPPELEVLPGDVLMSRASGSTELIGSVALVREQPVAKLYLSDKTFRLRVKTSKCMPEFLVFVMGSAFLRNQIEQCIRGAEGLANNIAQSDISEFLVPVPPPAEQRAIVAYIATETAKLGGLRAATERTIALLKERRAALIAAAVTGQIDVGVTA